MDRPGGRVGGPIDVLHVDDDPEFADLAATMLERADERIGVETVTDPADGLAGLDAVDCVVSDFDMPGADGIEFLERVRADHPDLPFVLFTGKGSEEVASEAIAAGVTDYVQKDARTEVYEVLANRVANAVAHHRAERRSAERAERLEQLRRHVSDVVWITTPEKDEMQFVSDSYAEVWGRPTATLEADPTSFLEAVHPEDRDRVRAARRDQLEDPDGYEATYRVVHPDGEVRWVADRSAGVRDDDGGLAAIVGVASDVTALKERERELREATAFAESALEIAVDFYWAIDLEGYVTAWSDEDGAVTGYPESEAVGLHTSTFHPDEHFPRIESAIEEIETTGTGSVVADLLRKDGERVPFEFAGTVITDDAGEVRSLCGVGRRRDRDLA